MSNAEEFIFVHPDEHIPENTTIYIRCVAAYSWAQAVTKNKAVNSCGAVAHELAHHVTFPSTCG